MVQTEDIVFVQADGNYSDVYLFNGKPHKMTFKLHFFDETFQQLQNNMFVRVGKMHYLGSLVAGGKEIEDDLSRRGYCAMANDNIVIGISRSEDVKDYVLEHKGSFYRTADGTVHTMGNDTTFDARFKGKDIIPWLVFKKR